MAEQNQPSKRAPESSKFWDVVMRKESPEPAPTPPRRRDPRMEFSYILNPVDDIYEANRREAAREHEPNYALPAAIHDSRGANDHLFNFAFPPALPSGNPIHPTSSHPLPGYDRYPALDLQYHEPLHTVRGERGPVPRRLPPMRMHEYDRTNGESSGEHRDLRTGPEHVEASQTNGMHHPNRNQTNGTHHANGGPSSEGEESTPATNHEQINGASSGGKGKNKGKGVRRRNTDERTDTNGDSMDMDHESHQSQNQQPVTLPSIDEVFATDYFWRTPLSEQPDAALPHVISNKRFKGMFIEAFVIPVQPPRRRRRATFH
ncbi:hypothetical protein F5Y04DRAFT_76243 [Hypomontagnella monticulosa]|nr:hypothetical protein F5Y04DRAFT_76243 [Hypomontagnella monticulosa]